MGYTHYIKPKRAYKEDRSELVRDIEAVYAQALVAGIELAEEYDIPDNQPVVTNKEIRFNGVGDIGHETFHVDMDTDNDGFLFCKTARKPYDAVVVAVMVLLHHHDPDWAEFVTDGDRDDMVKGIDLAREAISKTTGSTKGLGNSKPLGILE